MVEAQEESRVMDWPLAIGLVAFVVLCGILFWISSQAEAERVHEPHRDLVVHWDDSDAGDGRVRHP